MKLKNWLLWVGLFLWIQGIVSGAVITVGPTGDFTTVHRALAAANEGDVIYVDKGDYYTPLIIDNRSVTILAKAGVTPCLKGTVIVKNLDKSQIVNLINLKFSSSFPGGAGLVLKDNEGAVRVENCNISGCSGIGLIYLPEFHPNGWPGMRIKGCKNVGISNCYVAGGGGSSVSDEDNEAVGDGVAGLLVESSKNIACYNCEFHGGSGGCDYDNDYLDGGDAGDGCVMIGKSKLFVSGCKFVGGDGGWAGFYKGKGGNGGDGIEVKNIGILRTQDIITIGGQAGMGKPYGKKGVGIKVHSSASLRAYKGMARLFKSPSPAEEKQAGTLCFEGEPNEMAGLVLSLRLDSKWSSCMNGQRLLEISPSSWFLFFGVIPPSGKLYKKVRFGDLGLGKDHLIAHMQGIFRNSSGEIFLANPRTLVVLDETF